MRASDMNDGGSSRITVGSGSTQLHMGRSSMKRKMSRVRRCSTGKSN
jgi:hypothetical protein